MFFSAFLDIKIFGRYFLTIDISLPIVSPFFPESAKLLVSPSFPDINNIVIFADFSIKIQITEFFPTLLQRITFDIDLYIPILIIK